MAFIYLHKLNVEETIRIDPDDIRMIEAPESGGSLVTFKNDDFMSYRETPAEITRKEWRMSHFWPNLERLIVGVIGGVVGSLLTLLVKSVGK